MQRIHLATALVSSCYRHSSFRFFFGLRLMYYSIIRHFMHLLFVLHSDTVIEKVCSVTLTFCAVDLEVLYAVV